MALKATIFKAKVSLSNLNIHHYDELTLTIARHPSENSLRMMVRILAYLLSAQEGPVFTKGISTDTEPDIWMINHDGSIDHWIELGHLDERRIRQSSSKAKKVSIYTTRAIRVFNGSALLKTLFLDLTILISLILYFLMTKVLKTSLFAA